MGIRPASVSSYGPIAQEERIPRRLLDLDSNQTSSYIPQEFLDLDESDVEYEEKLAKPVKDLINHPEQTVNLEELCKTAEKAEEAIKDHFEEGIQLFYLTARHCFKSNMVFSIGDTEIQGGLKGKAKQKKGPQMLVEAHNSFFAGLLVVTKEDSDNFKLGKIKKLEPRIFGKETDFFHRLGATTTLPNFVNTVDTSVVCHTAPKRLLKQNLRDLCAERLNYIAEGKLTPQEGLEALLNDILQILDALNEKKPSTKKYYQIVQGFYREVTEEMITVTQNEEELKKLGTSDEKTARTLRKRLINDRRCYLSFDKILDRITTILQKVDDSREKIHHIEMLAKGAILHLASSSPLFLNLEKHIEETETVQAHRYVLKYRSEKKVLKYCQKHLEDYSTVDEIVKHLDPLKKKIKAYIKTAEGIKKLNSINNIVIRCLQHADRIKNVSLPVEWFFSISYDNLDNFEKEHAGFFGDMTHCLADKNLYKMVISLLKKLKYMYEKRVEE